MSGAMVVRGDALSLPLEDESVQTCVTSPPYWGLRDYGVDGQLGLEPTPDAYVEKLLAVFREVRRVLREDGTLWLNLGDSYAGSGKGGNPEDSKWSGFVGSSDREASAKASGKVVPDGLKPKDMVGIPWRVAFALQQDGWWLRSDIVWHKPNPMPESVTDRPTSSHEHIFLLAKSRRYYYDHEAIREPDKGTDHPRNETPYIKRGYPDGVSPHRGLRTEGGRNGSGRNKRDVWTVTTKPFPDAHFAVYPPELIVPCIQAGSRKGDLVMDPFCGAGTTGVVCTKLGRRFVGVELNGEYARMARKRIYGTPMSLFSGDAA